MYRPLNKEQRLDIANWARRYSGQRFPTKLVMDEFKAKYGWEPSKQGLTYWVRKAMYEPANIQVPPAYARMLDKLVADGLYPSLSEAAMAAIQLLAASKETRTQFTNTTNPTQPEPETNSTQPTTTNQGEITNAINQ